MFLILLAGAIIAIICLANSGVLKNIGKDGQDDQDNISGNATIPMTTPTLGGGLAPATSSSVAMMR